MFLVVVIGISEITVTWCNIGYLDDRLVCGCLQLHLDSGGHGETGSPPVVDDQPEFFKEHETIENNAETFLAASQSEPVTVGNGQATYGQSYLGSTQFSAAVFFKFCGPVCQIP